MDGHAARDFQRAVFALLFETLATLYQVDVYALDTIARLGLEEVQHLGAAQASKAELPQRHLGAFGVRWPAPHRAGLWRSS